MVEKLLCGYPQGVMKRASDYNYSKAITFHKPTVNEILLLNTINAKHCNYAYGRNTLPISMCLVALSEFLAFFEHLQLYKRLNTSQINVDVSETVNINRTPAHSLLANSLDTDRNGQGIDVLKKSNVGETHQTRGQAESNTSSTWVRVETKYVTPLRAGMGNTKRLFQVDDVSACDKQPNKISKVNQSNALIVCAPLINPITGNIFCRG